MQRIALIGDIHGNLPALESVLADIDQRGVDQIICLGDLAGKGPHGAQVVEICRERCDVVLLGNWDDALSRPQQHPSMRWYQQELGPERCAWLGALPFSHDLVLSGQRIRLVHASPQGINRRVHQAGPIEPMLEMFETTDATDSAFVPDVVGYADIHTSFVRTFHQKTLVNVGSVGNPLDTTLATCVVLEGNINGTRRNPWGIQIVRVPYDIDRALADARAAGSPDYAAYKWELTTARYRGAMPPIER